MSDLTTSQNSANHSGHCGAASHGCGHSRDGIFGPNTELIFAGFCGLFLVAGWSVKALSVGIPPSVSLSCLIASYGFGGYFAVQEAVTKIRGGRFEIDFLMIVAAAGAAVLGVWTEGAFLLFLFSLGHSLEGFAMGRAKQAIESLSSLSPTTATVRRNGSEVEVSVSELVVGDVVIVKPDQRVSADGFVVKGRTSINQAPITGESVAVDKRPVDNLSAAATDPESLSPETRVFAGTINQEGEIDIQVTKTSADNTLARVIRMVNESETRVSPTQTFTKKFERYFVPAVILTVISLMFAPLVMEETFGESFYRAMAALVASSPCALAISTPSAVLSGIARAARGGILIKGGGPLESLGRVRAIAFDKTGTLTTGTPTVTDVRTVEGVSTIELLRLAIAAENHSRHPLAKAIVLDGLRRLEASTTSEASVAVPLATDLKILNGRGIQAMIEGEIVHMGNSCMFDEIDGTPLPDHVREIAQSLESDGRTTAIVRRGPCYLGVIGLMDAPRESAHRTIVRLRELGVSNLVMISGDNQTVADSVARAVGLDQAFGSQMPEDKVAAIETLSRHGGVAMVGDGVNDAPALAAADVGIAIGGAGSDVALETADVVLMSERLEHLTLAIGLSRATCRIIRQNLFISLGMIAILVPATIFGLSIGPAVVLHEGSTLVVVINALRLLAFKEVSAAPR